MASRLLPLALVLALPACAAKSKAPVGGLGNDFLRPYVGQHRVLRFQGDQERVVVKSTDRPQLPGACDAAVEVRGVFADKGGPRLVLEALGMANAEKAHPRCGDIPARITLSLTGFGGEAAPTALRIDQVLPTPEGYLRAYGVEFDRAAGSEPTLAASSPQQANTTDQERRLEAKLTAPPRRVFWVDPIHRDPRRAVRHEGEVEVEGIVGTDGRLYRPRLRGGLDKAHEATILRALPLWRFEPARTGNDPTAAHVLTRLVFRIY
jgi:hypothetical protein